MTILLSSVLAQGCLGASIVGSPTEGTGAMVQAPIEADVHTDAAPAEDMPTSDVPTNVPADASTLTDTPTSVDASTEVDASIPADGGAPRVITASGTLVGRRIENTMAFLGIPYAAPPVGALRWRPPAPPAAWSGERPALAFGSACPQLHGEVIEGSEDCLFLNVWAPATPPAPGESRPVMVFVHGGGFSTGAASLQLRDADGTESNLYDGRYLAEHGAVVVTLNYRLGALGFLAERSLSAEGERGTSGNYGLLDQVAALQWVQRNAAAFGGNPHQVLLFGQSAGGGSVCAHIASPLSARLFSRAAVHSGSCRQGVEPLAYAESRGADFAASLGCGAAGAACLRARSVEEILAARDPQGSPFKAGPSIDLNFLHLAPPDAFVLGAYNHVPVLVGSTAEETAPDPMVRAIMTSEQGRAALAEWFGPSEVEALSALYPASPTAPEAAFEAATTDSWFTCPAGQIARSLSRSVAVYRYFFTHRVSIEGQPRSAFHGAELLFLFQRPPSDEQALGDAMVGYWTRFAATGDVNGPGAAVWPRFIESHPATLRLDDTLSVMDDVHPEACAYWDRPL